MNFVKELNDNDIIINSLQMRINFYETGNVAYSRGYVIQYGDDEAVESLKTLNSEQLATIERLRRIKKERENVKI